MEYLVRVESVDNQRHQLADFSLKCISLSVCHFTSVIFFQRRKTNEKLTTNLYSGHRMRQNLMELCRDWQNLMEVSEYTPLFPLTFDIFVRSNFKRPGWNTKGRIVLKLLIFESFHLYSFLVELLLSLFFM